MTPKLYILDMDGTLIDHDCDVSWKEFLVAEGIAPRSDLALVDKFFADYNAGTLDHAAFIAFQFREFVGRSVPEMAEIAQRHFDKVVRPKCRPGAVEFVNRAKASGAATLILSSTCTVISEPVRAFLGIDRACGTTPELSPEGRYTGKISGEYALGPNKVNYMRRFAEEYGITPAAIAACGDSMNDVPLLSAVGTPLVVNPSPALAETALKRNWPILDWNRCGAGPK